MKRLRLFLAAYPLGSKLQLLVLLIILGNHAWVDYQLGYTATTFAIFLFALLIGRLLMPLMVAHPQRTIQVLGAFGLTFLAVYIFARNEWWWRTAAAHFGREFAMWLDLSCAFWFVSEIHLQRERETIELMFGKEDEA